MNILKWARFIGVRHTYSKLWTNKNVNLVSYITYIIICRNCETIRQWRSMRNKLRDPSRASWSIEILFNSIPLTEITVRRSYSQTLADWNYVVVSLKTVTDLCEMCRKDSGSTGLRAIRRDKGLLAQPLSVMLRQSAS